MATAPNRNCWQEARTTFALHRGDCSTTRFDSVSACALAHLMPKPDRGAITPKRKLRKFRPFSRCLSWFLLYDGIVTSSPACQIAEADPAQEVASKPAHVQTNSDRKSRRDRMPGHQDCPPHGDRDGRGLFRSRPRRAPCRNARLCRL